MQDIARGGGGGFMPDDFCIFANLVIAPSPELYIDLKTKVTIYLRFLDNCDNFSAY